MEAHRLTAARPSPAGDGAPAAADAAPPARPLRVLHCPANVSGTAWGLAQAERALGLHSHLVMFEGHPFRYRADEILWSESDGRFRRECKRWGLLRRALRDFDIVHFHFGSTMMPVRRAWHDPELRRCPPALRWAYWLYGALCEQRDLARLRRAGKGIAVTFQGDDARQGDVLRRRFAISAAPEVAADFYLESRDRDKRRRIARFGRLAHRIYAQNPDLLHVLPPTAEFVPYGCVDPAQWIADGPAPGANPRPVVLHAPSDRCIKGTRFILDAVDRLRREDGLDFEFRLVEGLPHDEARRLYRQADLLVDQLLVGWYGVLGVELMALGRPVVCYLREEDLEFLPPEMRRDLPVIPAAPTTIYDVLKTWLTHRRSELAERGARGRAYVERWHSPARIAARMKRDYEQMLEPSI